MPDLARSSNPTLPHELWSFVYEAIDKKLRLSTLSHLALVCKLWRIPAQAALIRHIFISADEEVCRFCCAGAKSDWAIGTNRADVGACETLYLDLRWPSIWCSRSESIEAALPHLTRLRKLNLCCCNVEPIAVLNLVPTLSRLALNRVELSFDSSAFVELAPNLEVLSIIRCTLVSSPDRLLLPFQRQDAFPKMRSVTFELYRDLFDLPDDSAFPASHPFLRGAASDVEHVGTDDLSIFPPPVASSPGIITTSPTTSPNLHLLNYEASFPSFETSLALFEILNLFQTRHLLELRIAHPNLVLGSFLATLTAWVHVPPVIDALQRLARVRLVQDDELASEAAFGAIQTSLASAVPGHAVDVEVEGTANPVGVGEVVWQRWSPEQERNYLEQACLKLSIPFPDTPFKAPYVPPEKEGLGWRPPDARFARIVEGEAGLPEYSLDDRLSRRGRKKIG